MDKGGGLDKEGGGGGLPLSPNNPPTTAQGSPGVVGGHPEIAIFQPTHAGLKTAKDWSSTQSASY